MPWIKPEDKPSFLNKPNSDVPPKAADKKTAFFFDSKKDFPAPKKDQPLPIQKSIRAYDLRRHLESLAGRKEVAAKLKIQNPYSPENKPKIDQAIEDILAKVKNFGTIIDPAEMRSLDSPTETLERYWRTRRAMEEERKDNVITPQEIKARSRPGILSDILKKFWGKK